MAEGAIGHGDGLACVLERRACAMGVTAERLRAGKREQELVAEVERLRADLALQADALLRWREMTGAPTPYAAMEQHDAAMAEAAALRAAVEDPNPG
jgi:hypothetical protein